MVWKDSVHQLVQAVWRLRVVEKHGHPCQPARHFIVMIVSPCIPLICSMFKSASLCLKRQTLQSSGEERLGMVLLTCRWPCHTYIWYFVEVAAPQTILPPLNDIHLFCSTAACSTYSQLISTSTQRMHLIVGQAPN